MSILAYLQVHGKNTVNKVNSQTIKTMPFTLQTKILKHRKFLKIIETSPRNDLKEKVVKGYEQKRKYKWHLTKDTQGLLITKSTIAQCCVIVRTLCLLVSFLISEGTLLEILFFHLTDWQTSLKSSMHSWQGSREMGILMH